MKIGIIIIGIALTMFYLIIKHTDFSYDEMMEEHNNVICIAMSSIFSTGISINNLHYVLFALIGKAKVKLIQSIGRGLRLHENKNKVVIYDLCDNLPYSKRHSRKRKRGSSWI